MSLLDDVSIVVTPNGYKAGELYAVIPVPTEGAEQVVNGDFATDSDWTPLGGWAISGGSANCNGGSIMYTNASIIATKIYKITYTVSGFVSGGVKVRINASPDVDGLVRTSNGTFTEYITSSSSPNGNFSFAAASSFVGSIDNVSLKEYTSADMDVTRATAATRVDENGLVNYAEVLSETELVTCGNFECAVPLDYWNVNGTATISSGKANINSPSGETAEIYQNNVLEIGKSYTLICDLDKTSGDTQFVNGGTFILANGSNNIFFTATQTRVFFKRGAGSVISSIDNVSVKEVTRDNVPRIDYTGGGCPHILAEPQRTNTTTRSNELDLWGAKSNVTITPDYSLSPDGSINSNRLLFSANGFTHNNLTQVISTIYSISVYAKRNSGTENVGFFVNGSGAVNYAFNLTNEWQRFEYTYTSTNTSTFGIAGLSGADVSIFGFQSEVASYPTSYIPTSGSTVTRNQDIFTRDGIGSLINSTEGVLFVEMAALSDDSDSKRITISDGTLTNRITISIASNIISGFINVNNVTQYTFYESGITTTDFNKIAIKYKVNDFAIWINGVEYDVDTSGITFSADTLNTLNFSNATNLSNFFNGKVKQLQVYDTALTDEQLLQLTGESGTDFYESYAEMASALTYTIQ